ncbi:unnamed protein product [Ectocarpus sp. 8 AP-2014]
MELLNQLDGFEDLGQVKMVMATNRPGKHKSDRTRPLNILDPALLRPGRLDRKIEIPLPNETSRLDIIKIHSASITKRGEIDFESVVKVSKRKRGMLRRLGSEQAKIRTSDCSAWVVVHTLDGASLRLAVWRAVMGVYAQFHTRFLTRPFRNNVQAAANVFLPRPSTATAVTLPALLSPINALPAVWPLGTTPDLQLADGFNGADLRNVGTEAGLFAIRADRDYVLEEDFMKAVRKIAENKKLEGKVDYAKV